MPQVKRKKSFGNKNVSKVRRGAPAGYRSGGYRNRRRAGSRMSPELKYLDTSIGSSMDTTGNIIYLGAISSGAGENARIGRKINIRSIEMKFGITGSATCTQVKWRWMLVYDRQPNKALAGWTDLLTTKDVFSFKNDQNRERFVILKDKMGTTVGNNTTAGQNTDKTAQVAKYYKRCKLPVVYGNAGTGAIGDTTTGALLFFALGSVAPGTADATLVGNARVRFDDN